MCAPVSLDGWIRKNNNNIERDEKLQEEKAKAVNDNQLGAIELIKNVKYSE